MAPLTFEPQSIAVIQTAFLGDVVFTSPLVRTLKEAWPAACLTFVCTPKAGPLAACVPGVDRVVTYDKRRGEAGLGGLRAKAAELQSEVVVVPHPSIRSAVLARLSGARVRVGHARLASRLLYNVPVPPRDREPFVQRFLDLARALDLEGRPELELRAPAEARAHAEQALAGRPAVALVVGSEWATKRWPPEHYASLADRLSDEGLHCVLLGAPSERPIAEAVKTTARRARFIDLMGNSIVESVGVLSLTKAAIGGDSGLLHAARALGTPTLLLFGPTDPGAQQLEPHAQALRLGLACQPCHPHGPPTCPKGHHDCMRALSPDRVLEALHRLWARTEAA